MKKNANAIITKTDLLKTKAAYTCLNFPKVKLQLAGTDKRRDKK